MKTQKIGLLALVSLLLTTAALAQSFTALGAPLEDEQSFPFDAAPLTITTERTFTVSEEVGATLELAEATTAAFNVDLLMSDDGENFTTLATAENTTTPTAEFTINGTAAIRAVVHVLDDSGLTADTTDSFAFIVTLNNTANQGGNGGEQAPSLGHVLNVYWYDAATDSDADGLADNWETANFGDLSATGEEDPDGDGFTNEEEETADTDPNNSASRPTTEIYSGAGGEIDDREAVHIVLGVTLWLVIGAVVVFAISKPAKERGGAAIVGAIAGAAIVATVVLALLDRFLIGGASWQWWADWNIDWMEAIGLSAIWAAAGIVGIVGFLQLRQSQEKKFGLILLVVAVVAFVAAGALAYFYELANWVG